MATQSVAQVVTTLAVAMQAVVTEFQAALMQHMLAGHRVLMVRQELAVTVAYKVFQAAAAAVTAAAAAVYGAAVAVDHRFLLPV